MDKYLILPSSGDLNRGDQALTWETMRVAKESGYDGEYYILASNKSSTKQSQEYGLETLSPILKHPSRKFKSKENSYYGRKLKLKWGLVAIIDLIKTIFLLTSITRNLILPILSTEEKKTMKIMKSSKGCFVKGGGFIHSSGKITDTYTVYFQLFHLMLAHSLGKPVYIMPNSFGPFDGFAIKWMVNKTLKKCKLVTVRESISQSMLENIGVKSKIFPDLGFKLTKNISEDKIIIDLKKKYKNKKLVGITVRPYRFPESKEPELGYEKYIKSMVEFCRWLYADGCIKRDISLFSLNKFYQKQHMKVIW